MATAVSEVGSIMEVVLVPFGNAKFAHGKLECQHGEDECKANSWEQCAIHLYPEFSKHWPFYLCIEEKSKSCGEDAGPCVLKHVKKCAEKAGLDYDDLSACVDDKAEALALQHEFAKETPSDHEYVPWVTVDGKLRSDKKTLVQQVCKAYKGTKPAACEKADVAASPSNATICAASW